MNIEETYSSEKTQEKKKEKEKEKPFQRHENCQLKMSRKLQNSMYTGYVTNS